VHYRKLDPCIDKNVEDINSIIDRITGTRNLDKIGRKSTIEYMIRRRAPLRPRQKNNLLSLLKDDMRREWPEITIARGMRAVIGAVYYDGGYDAARRAMVHLKLIIQPA
jgi:dsRNA-specific ribonuclease